MRAAETETHPPLSLGLTTRAYAHYAPAMTAHESYNATRDLFTQVIQLRAALDITFHMLALGNNEQALEYLGAIIDSNTPEPNLRERP